MADPDGPQPLTLTAGWHDPIRVWHVPGPGTWHVQNRCMTGIDLTGITDTTPAELFTTGPAAWRADPRRACGHCQPGLLLTYALQIGPTLSAGETTRIVLTCSRQRDQHITCHPCRVRQQWAETTGLVTDVATDGHITIAGPIPSGMPDMIGTAGHVPHPVPAAIREVTPDLLRVARATRTPPEHPWNHATLHLEAAAAILAPAR